jgi:cytochrome P450
MELSEVDITSMPRYVEQGYPWDDWDLLRQRAPVYWYAGRARFSGFWAVTRWTDVRYVSSHPDRPAPHLANLQLAGPPQRLPGLHVGAVAHLPVRWID